MRELSLRLRDFEVSMRGPKKQERIWIKSGYPAGGLAQMLFSNLGLMHLVAPYLPQTIKTDFPIHPRLRHLVAAMYASEGKSAPAFCSPKGEWRWPCLPKTNPRRVVVAYSGGKDSMWNLWWTQERYGERNVLAVHIHGINRGQGYEEKYVRRQRQAWGFPLRVITLGNSSLSFGNRIMRSRDMFLAGLIIPLALEFGAGKIVIEGRSLHDPTAYFTYQAKNFRYFNRILKELGIPVRVTWRVREEMDTIKDLFIHRPEWMPRVCNCFTAACYKDFHREAWRKRSRTFPLYRSQCGVCVKCRVVNVGRLLYDPKSRRIRRKHARAFLLNNVRWIRNNRARMADFIEGTFLRDFRRAARKYGLDVSAVA